MSVRLSKKTKRAISADQAIERYWHNMRAFYEREMMRRFRLAQIVQRRDDGVDLLLQINTVIDTGYGIRIEVR